MSDFRQALADLRQRFDDPLGDYDSVRETALIFAALDLDDMERAHAELEAEHDFLIHKADYLCMVLATETGRALNDISAEAAVATEMAIRDDGATAEENDAEVQAPPDADIQS